jgi:hypothetical protein
MGTRTVYVKDPAVWKQAKALAPHESLSSIVEDALRRWVTQQVKVKQAIQVHVVTVGPERYRFEGRRVAARVLPGKRLSGENVSVAATVYLLSSGKLVLVTKFSDRAEASYVCRSPWEIGQSLKDVLPDERDDFLEHVSAALGEDWAVLLE